MNTYTIKLQSGTVVAYGNNCFFSVGQVVIFPEMKVVNGTNKAVVKEITSYISNGNSHAEIIVEPIK